MRARRNRFRGHGHGASVARVVAALRALRSPRTTADVAQAIGVHWRTAYRLIEQLAAVDAIEPWGELPRPDRRGRGTKRYRLAAEWLS